MNWLKRRKGFLLLIVVLGLLTGCSGGAGGGGGGGGIKTVPSNPAGGSAWDQMIWDQGQWG